METTSSSSKMKKADGSSNGSGKAPELTAGDRAPLPSSAVKFSPPANISSIISIGRSVVAAGSVAGAGAATGGGSGNGTTAAVSVTTSTFSSSGGGTTAATTAATTGASSKSTGARQQQHHHQNSNNHGGNTNSKRLQFPDKLHRLLKDAERDGNQHIVSWTTRRAFKVHDSKEFSAKILPRHFATTTYKSFQRNLNLWGFTCIAKGENRGVCYHPYFIRGDEGNVSHHMKRSQDNTRAKKRLQNIEDEIPPDILDDRSGGVIMVPQGANGWNRGRVNSIPSSRTNEGTSVHSGSSSSDTSAPSKISGAGSQVGLNASLLQQQMLQLQQQQQLQQLLGLGLGLGLVQPNATASMQQGVPNLPLVAALSSQQMMQQASSSTKVNQASFQQGPAPTKVKSENSSASSHIGSKRAKSSASTNNRPTTSKRRRKEVRTTQASNPGADSLNMLLTNTQGKQQQQPPISQDQGQQAGLSEIIQSLACLQQKQPNQAPQVNNAMASLQQILGAGGSPPNVQALMQSMNHHHQQQPQQSQFLQPQADQGSQGLGQILLALQGQNQEKLKEEQERKQREQALALLSQLSGAGTPSPAQSGNQSQVADALRHLLGVLQAGGTGTLLQQPRPQLQPQGLNQFPQMFLSPKGNQTAFATNSSNATSPGSDVASYRSGTKSSAIASVSAGAASSASGTGMSDELISSLYGACKSPDEIAQLTRLLQSSGNLRRDKATSRSSKGSASVTTTTTNSSTRGRKPGMVTGSESSNGSEEPAGSGSGSEQGSEEQAGSGESEPTESEPNGSEESDTSSDDAEPFTSKVKVEASNDSSDRRQWDQLLAARPANASQQPTQVAEWMTQALQFGNQFASPAQNGSQSNPLEQLLSQFRQNGNGE
eukprot:CAMPEP_0113495582 /NCGR_PEP_ID=MMETSP0014_2-20120614/29683_1 /TAXON_ID=2857 /ORGANISM="Nitzschia sp." /LENGTH=882 /DNA_ID=CAMNT_0000389483 /DNA_START=156 /DNA_END=2804 /DNA_ORIENTATION=+ /assembly_acc=CAM_ASM_000159